MVKFGVYLLAQPIGFLKSASNHIQMFHKIIVWGNTFYIEMVTLISSYRVLLTNV